MNNRYLKIKASRGYELGVSILNAEEKLPAILLLNGSAFNYLQWQTLLRRGFYPRAWARYKIIRYDYGGTGASVVPSGIRWDAENLVSEIESVLDALSITKVHLYGISMGTIVGQAMVCFAPQRVASLAGYGWYFHRYTALDPLSQLLMKRLAKFSELSDYFNKLLNWESFKVLWIKVYREIVFAKSVEKFTPVDWLIDFYLQRKLFPILKPTPIGVIKDWFEYALTQLPKIGSVFDRIKPLSEQVPILIQHAQYDETLPIEMARELNSWAKSTKLLQYPKPFSHLSPAFKPAQARHLIGDYLDWLGAV